jgi:hypothetical protein
VHTLSLPIPHGAQAPEPLVVQTRDAVICVPHVRLQDVEEVLFGTAYEYPYGRQALPVRRVRQVLQDSRYTTDAQTADSLPPQALLVRPLRLQDLQ